VLKLTAAEAMHPPAPPSGKPILLERLQGFWRMLGTTTQLSLRNLFRSRLRSVLTWIGLTICYALIAAVFAFSPMVDLMMRSENFTEVQRYDLKAGLAEMADARALESALSHMRALQPWKPCWKRADITQRRAGKGCDIARAPNRRTLSRLSTTGARLFRSGRRRCDYLPNGGESGVEPGDVYFSISPTPTKKCMFLVVHCANSIRAIMW
jgi:hypothetical protein